MLERLPKLKQWKSAGPGYWHEPLSEDEKINSRLLYFSFTPRKWSEREPYLSGQFHFPAKGTVQWEVRWKKRNREYHTIRHSIDSVSSAKKTLSGGTVRVLDAEKMTKTFEEAARKLSIV